MPHKEHRAEHTHREIQALFASALAGPKGFVDGPEIARMHALRVNGKAIGDSRPRLAKSYSVHYSKEENESLAVARALVQLNRDGDVEDIIERDKPDIRVNLRDGSSVYVEVRLVESGQIRESRFLEDANHVVLSSAPKDQLLRERLAQSNVTISLQSLPAVSMHTLLKETQAFIKGIIGNENMSENVPAIFPVLHLAGARAFWRPKGYEQSRVLQLNTAWVDGDYIGAGAREAIAEKLDAAKAYDPACVPLWLLLGVVDMRALPHTASAIMGRVFDEVVDATPFSKLIATAAGMTIVSKALS